MQTYGFTIAEHDRDRPWIILAQRHETVVLEDETSFTEWASRRYPRERFTVEPDPWTYATDTFRRHSPDANNPNDDGSA